MSTFKRTKLFIDPRVQGAILTRIITYWVCCILFITLPMMIMMGVVETETTMYEHFQKLWQNAGPMLIAALLLLPLAVYDVLKLTNKFAGPIHRFRRELARMAKGEDVNTLEFRGKDFWEDLAESYNLILDRLNTNDDQGLETETEKEERVESNDSE